MTTGLCTVSHYIRNQIKVIGLSPFSYNWFETVLMLSWVKVRGNLICIRLDDSQEGLREAGAYFSTAQNPPVARLWCSQPTAVNQSTPGLLLVRTDLKVKHMIRMIFTLHITANNHFICGDTVERTDLEKYFSVLFQGQYGVLVSFWQP